MSVNIAHGKHMSDPFYRYKRDLIQWQGNRIVNWDTICRQLKTPPNHLQSFLSKKLGCRVDKGTITAQATVGQLEALVQQYTEAHVLCSVCKLPELDNTRRCKSCGAKN